MLRSPPIASPTALSDVPTHSPSTSPSRSPTKNHAISSIGTCSPLRPAIDERSKTTIFASIINTKLPQIRSMLDSAPSPAYVAALLACRRDEETPFDPDLAEDAARLLGKASTVGMTPLQVALMSLDAEDPAPWIARGEGNLVEVRREIIRMLIEATPLCDLDNVTWGISNTVLHLASFLGEQDAVHRLLERGAKSTARNALNFAPMDVAADEETRNIFLRYAEEESKRKPRKFHRKPEREWKSAQNAEKSSSLTNERRPSYGSPRSRVEVVAKENAAETEEEMASNCIMPEEQDTHTTNGPSSMMVPLASSNRVVTPLRLRTQSANPTAGVQADDILKSPPCRTTTVSSSGILSTTTVVRESTTTGDMSREDDGAKFSKVSRTAEVRGMLGSASLVSKNPFRESAAQSPGGEISSSIEVTGATAKTARGALEAALLVSKNPFRTRHESSNDGGGSPRNYQLSPSPAGMSKSKSTAFGFSQSANISKSTGVRHAGFDDTLPSESTVEEEKTSVHENSDIPVAHPVRQPKRTEPEESLSTVRDNPFFRRLNAPGADVGLVPRPQSLLEQWGSAQKLKKEVRRREPAHLMAGGGVISEKEWKEKKMKDKLYLASTSDVNSSGSDAPTAQSNDEFRTSVAELEIGSPPPTPAEEEETKTTLDTSAIQSDEREAARQERLSAIEELAVKEADVDQMLKSLLEGNTEEIDELSSQEGGSVCIHSDDDADGTQEADGDLSDNGSSIITDEDDLSEEGASVIAEDHETEISVDVEPAGMESPVKVDESKALPVSESTSKQESAKVSAQKKFVIPKLVLRKGVTYQLKTRIVSGRFCATAPVPTVSPDAPMTIPIPRPLPLPPSTLGRRARIPQITASVPGQDKFMFTKEVEYVCTSAFATGAEGMENGRLYVRLHAMECSNASKDVFGFTAIGGHGGSGMSGTGINSAGEQSFVYCTLVCDGNSVCTRPVAVSSGKIVIDEEFELAAQPGSVLTVKLAVLPPTQGMGGIESFNSPDNSSTKSKQDGHGLGRKLRMMFQSPSSQNLTGMAHGGTFNSRKGLPEQFGMSNSSLDGAPVAKLQIPLNCDRLSDWSLPNSRGNGLNQEWEMIAKSTAIAVPDEGSAGYGSRMGSRRAGKLSFRKGKKHWPNDSTQNSVGPGIPARNVTVGTVKASVVFWPFVGEMLPRNFDQCVKVLLERQEAGVRHCSPVQLKSRLSNPENLPPGIIHKVLDVAFKAGCIKWSGTLSMRGADTKFWRRRYLVFYPPHLISLTTPESLADPVFCVALDLRQCHGLEAPFTRTQRGNDLWQAATNGFRLLFPGKRECDGIAASFGDEANGSNEDYMIEFSADSLEDAKSLVSSLEGTMISLGISF